MPILGLYTLSLQNPASMTYLTPSTVSDVSAMFVDTTHLHQPPRHRVTQIVWRGG